MIALYSRQKNLKIRLLSAINGSARFGLRQAHYIRLAETHLQNIFTAAAINNNQIRRHGKGLAKAIVYSI
jgi:hypothetical protein